MSIAGMQKYILITYDKNKVGVASVNQPVYFDLALMPTSFFNDVQVSGNDIRVTNAAGSAEVPIDKVVIDTVAKTGELHFNSVALSVVADGSFRIYYKNAGASGYAPGDPLGAYNVYDTDGNYVLVSHLEIDSDQTPDEFHDWSGSGNHGVEEGSIGALAAVTAVISKGQDFDSGKSARINYGSDASLEAQSFTMSYWFKADNIAALNGLHSIRANETAVKGHVGITVSSKLNFFLTINGSTWLSIVSDSTLSSDTWYKADFVWESGNMKMYINGVEQADTDSTSGTVVYTDPSQSLRFGGGDTTAHKFAGLQDEIRYQDIVRSAGKLLTEYNNQSAPATFWKTIGSPVDVIVDNGLFAFAGL